jgi:NAD(P)-dependent dehydrogenase (short-subunit alcohol dehydrogenase family)
VETDLKGKWCSSPGPQGHRTGNALAFAKQGSRLALVDFDRAELELCAEIKGGRRATFGLGDLSTADGVKGGISAALGGQFDGVDVLFNNVGSGFVRTFDLLTDEDWDKTKAPS